MKRALMGSLSAIALASMATGAMAGGHSGPIKIGVLATLEGTYTVLGEDGMRGLNTALLGADGKAGGREIELIVLDDVRIVVGQLPLIPLIHRGNGLAGHVGEASPALPRPRRHHRATDVDRIVRRLEFDVDIVATQLSDAGFAEHLRIVRQPTEHERQLPHGTLVARRR